MLQWFSYSFRDYRDLKCLIVIVSNAFNAKHKNCLLRYWDLGMLAKNRPEVDMIITRVYRTFSTIL